MKYRIALVVLVAVMLVAVLGCNVNKTDPAVGTWTLTSMTASGTTLSGAALAAAGISMTLVVNDNNTYSTSGTMFGSTISETGKWSASGSTYTFTPDSGGSAGIATLSGNTLTVSSSSGAMVFTKN